VPAVEYRAAQTLVVPSHVSFTSQPPLPAVRHTVFTATLASAGQFAFEPVHVSVASHGPAAARHTVPDVTSVSAGQVTFEPSQYSERSQSPAVPRQTVLLLKRTSVGQLAELPGHTSAASQMPAAARHVEAGPRNPSAGQVALAPVHCSAASQGPPEALHTVAADCSVQVPMLPVRLQASQAPLHAVVQQTPSTQLPEVHWVSLEQFVPFESFARHMVPPQYWFDIQPVVSAGQETAPAQFSAGSQPPVEARHTVVLAAKPSLGQVALLPVQVSATSQAPATARH